jgi:ribosome biogenesis GTPase
MQVIAANIDQALLMVTIGRPRTSTGFIDRFLVTAEAYEIPVIILFNKVDDQTEDERVLMEELSKVYEGIGYQILQTSAEQRIGLADLEGILKDKVSLLSGHSGVGKSTLINSIAPGLELRTQSVSDFHSKGQHTTTFAEMFELPFGGKIIDTPGIKGFGLVDMEKSDIADQFPEFLNLTARCRFADCLHVSEPGCAIKQAVQEGRIAASRYRSYINMLDGNEEESPYRQDNYS